MSPRPFVVLVPFFLSRSTTALAAPPPLTPQSPSSPPSPVYSALLPGFACVRQDAVCAALGDFYASTTGPSWSWQGSAGHSWAASASNTSTEYCQLFGVTCTDGAVVDTIILGSNQLSGPLPASFFSALSTLTYLQLDHNALSGSLPSTIGSLTLLGELDLDHNSLRSQIPESLGRLASVQYLFLNANQLSGAMPTSMSSLTSVQFFNLASNNLYGPVPTSLSLLSNLHSLALAGSGLCGAWPGSFVPDDGPLPACPGVYSSLLPGFSCSPQDATCAAMGDLYAAAGGSSWIHNYGESSDYAGGTAGWANSARGVWAIPINYSPNSTASGVSTARSRRSTWHTTR